MTVSHENPANPKTGASWKNWVRFLGPLVIMGIAALLLRDKMPFLATGYQEVLSAKPTGLVLAFLAVIASIVVMAEVMHTLLNAGGANVRSRDTLQLTFIANSWSATFPGGAALSAVYQFHTMRNWGVNVLVSSWFIVVSAALSTVWLIALGLISVFFFGADFSLWPMLGSVAIMLGLALLVWWVTNHPEPAKRLVVAVIIRAGRIVRRRPTKILDSIDEHFGQLDAVSLTPGKFSWVTLLSLMNWVFDIVAVWLCVWAVTDVLPGFRAVENNTTVLGVVLAFVTAKIVGTDHARRLRAGGGGHDRQPGRGGYDGFVGVWCGVRLPDYFLCIDYDHWVGDIFYFRCPRWHACRKYEFMKTLMTDIIAVLVFAVLARAAHGGLGLAQIADTFWPFAGGALGGTGIATVALRGAGGGAIRYGVIVWLVTVLTGLAIWAARHAAAPHISFIIVATTMSGLLLLGWRAARMLVARRRP